MGGWTFLHLATSLLDPLWNIAVTQKPQPQSFIFMNGWLAPTTSASSTSPTATTLSSSDAAQHWRQWTCLRIKTNIIRTWHTLARAHTHTPLVTGSTSTKAGEKRRGDKAKHTERGKESDWRAGVWEMDGLDYYHYNVIWSLLPICDRVSIPTGTPGVFLNYLYPLLCFFTFLFDTFYFYLINPDNIDSQGLCRSHRKSFEDNTCSLFSSLALKNPISTDVFATFKTSSYSTSTSTVVPIRKTVWEEIITHLGGSAPIIPCNSPPCP